MKYRPLGKTGFKISELSLGGLFVSKAGGGEFAQAKATVDAALALGVNFIDTAPTYSNSEETLGQTLVGVTAPYTISTKLGGRPQPFEPRNPECLRQSFENSLKLLKRDSVDMLFVHEPERPKLYDWWTNFDEATGPVLDFCQDLKRQGLVKWIGLGGTTVYEMLRLVKTGKFDVMLTAFNFNLLWREASNELIPTAHQLGMGIVVGSPLQQGALAKRWDDQINHGAPWLSPPRRRQYQALYRYLDELQMPVAELAIRFVISNPLISTTLMGARSPEEVALNAAAVAKGPLPGDILRRLDEIHALCPYYPCEEPAMLPFARDYKGPGPIRY